MVKLSILHGEKGTQETARDQGTSFLSNRGVLHVGRLRPKGTLGGFVSYNLGLSRAGPFSSMSSPLVIPLPAFPPPPPPSLLHQTHNSGESATTWYDPTRDSWKAGVSSTNHSGGPRGQNHISSVRLRAS